MKTLLIAFMMLVSLYVHGQEKQKQPKVDLRLEHYNNIMMVGGGFIFTGIFISGGSYVAMNEKRDSRDVQNVLMAGGAAMSIAGTVICFHAYRKGTKQKKLYLLPGELTYRF